jgi:hypothetical protein
MIIQVITTAIDCDSGYPYELCYENDELDKTEVYELVYPQTATFKSPKYIPESYLNDYNEAIMVIGASPKASAALTRRLLQNILHSEYKIEKKNLFDEIQSFLDLPNIPVFLSESLDAVRKIGKFAAHPKKSTATGEVIDVEPGEAEWLIEVIHSLFEFTFVQPEILKQRKKALDQKIEAIKRTKDKNK